MMANSVFFTLATPSQLPDNGRKLTGIGIGLSKSVGRGTLGIVPAPV